MTELRDVTARARAAEVVQAEAQVSAALVRVGRELTAVLDSPVMLDRLCQLTAAVLACDCSHLLLWKPEEDVFVPVAAYGDTAEQWETLRVLTVPRKAISRLLVRLEQEEAPQVMTGGSQKLLPTRLAREFGSEASLYLGLRRGERIVGILTAGRRRRREAFSVQQQRIAHGIAQSASLALAHDRTLEELKRANSSKTDFLATMSHELRTPLSVIMGYTRLLLDGDFGRLKAGQADILWKIDKSARELLDLITATLEVSRLETKEPALELQEVRLAELLRELEHETRGLREKPGLSFVWRVDAQLPPVHTDRTKLKVVLKHLIDNAAKFTEAGRITVDAHVKGEGVEIAVADTGAGIAPEVLPVIFDIFRQGAGPLTRQYEGIGLGLYVVRRTVELLGGSVSVESEVGRGSTFSVWVPNSEERGWVEIGKGMWGLLAAKEP